MPPSNQRTDVTAGTARDRLQEAGTTAWRTTVLATATVLILVIYLGMAYLVLRDQMSEGPLVLFTGVLMGYLLRSVRELV
jgi:anti-sigma-K factor RskA